MAAHTRPMGGRTQATLRGSEGSDLERDIAGDYRRHTGRWLKDARAAAGLTQLELSKLMGMDGTSSISSFEVGRGSIPPERYKDFATSLGQNERDMGLFMLRYTNPWLYALIYGDADVNLKRDIAALPMRGKTSIG